MPNLGPLVPTSRPSTSSNSRTLRPTALHHQLPMVLRPDRELHPLQQRRLLRQQLQQQLLSHHLGLHSPAAGPRLQEAAHPVLPVPHPALREVEVVVVAEVTDLQHHEHPLLWCPRKTSTLKRPSRSSTRMR